MPSLISAPIPPSTQQLPILEKTNCVHYVHVSNVSKEKKKKEKEEKDGRKGAGLHRERRSAGRSTIIHTSHFLFSIISFKPDNSESNLSQHVRVCVCACARVHVWVWSRWLCEANTTCGAVITADALKWWGSGRDDQPQLLLSPPLLLHSLTVYIPISRLGGSTLSHLNSCTLKKEPSTVRKTRREVKVGDSLQPS